MILNTVGVAVDDLTRAFATAGLDAAASDARRLVCAAGGLSPLDLTLRPEALLSEPAREKLRLWATRRLAREPVTRILGRRGFWSFELEVAPDVLDPRPDSETVVEACLRALGRSRIATPLRILDAGTGSGALLAALLTELPAATGLGVDVSEPAARLASRNLEALGLGGRCVIRRAGWETIPHERFDLVVSNPPYIAGGELRELDPEVRLFDPRLALDGGPDGLDAYRALAALTPGWLKDGGLAAFEIGLTQGAQVAGIMSDKCLEILEIAKDYAGLDRVVVVRKR